MSRHRLLFADIATRPGLLPLLALMASVGLGEGIAVLLLLLSLLTRVGVGPTVMISRIG